MKLSQIGKTQYTSPFKRLTAWTAFFVIVVTIIFTFSKTAHAGLLSFMNSLLGGEQASAKIESPVRAPNSQTLALLQAPANTDPNPNKSEESVPVNNNTLVADISASDLIGDDMVNTQISIYTVREGDTLSDIAAMFHVSVKTIMWSNDLPKSSDIHPGQTLVILPVSGINYIVKKGDTIQGIVGTYKVDLEEVLRYNDLTLKSTLTVGQTIILPDAELQTVVPTKSSVPNYTGYYIRPIVGGVKSQKLHGHNGVDLAAPVGTPIYAAAAGTVILSKSGGYNGGYGTYVIVSHPNKTQTVYAHNSINFVSVGDHVDKGDKIGLIGMTGKTTGPHVHFEIRGAVNPF